MQITDVEWIYSLNSGKEMDIKMVNHSKEPTLK